MANTKHLNELKLKAEKALVSESPVSDFMSKNAVLISAGTKIKNAIQTLTIHRVGSAPVVNAQNKIVGIISEHDLLIQTATKDINEPIVFTKDLVTVSAGTLLKDVLVLLYKKKVRRIPVLAIDQTVIGVVTRMDVLLRLMGKSKG